MAEPHDVSMTARIRVPVPADGASLRDGIRAHRSGPVRAGGGGPTLPGWTSPFRHPRMAEHDLGRMLRTIAVERRPGTFRFVELAAVPSGAVVHATVTESEGTTAIIEGGVPDDRDGPGTAAFDAAFAAAWLTVGVHSALDAVGLTAALSGALAAAGIACNVLAGLHHDHLLVPVHEADRAIAVLDGLRRGDGPGPG